MSAMGVTQYVWRTCSVILAMTASVHSAAAQQTLRVSASAQMTPMLNELANAFHELHDDITIDVTTEISGEAITGLRKGLVDYAAISRPPSREELRFFSQVDQKQLIGTPIAMGAVALIVRPDSPLKSMSVKQAIDVSLQHIYDWSKLDVVLDGSVVHEHSDACGHPINKGAFINLVVPTEGRDTLEYIRLIDRVPHLFPLDLPRMDSDEKIAHQVSFDANSVGLVSWSTYEGVRFVGIKEGAQAEGVLPSQQSIQSRAYPLSQYFYLYTSDNLTSQAKAFITFAISSEGQKIISLAGGIPLPMHATRD